MTVPILRPQQARDSALIDASWEAGNKNVMYVLPTGGGKSVVVSTGVAKRDALGRSQCVIAHRQELVSQMSLHVARSGVQHRVIGPDNVIASIVADHRREFGTSFINPSARCSVAGVDTLKSRFDSLAAWGAQQDDFVIDEAHHVLLKNKWGISTDLFPNANGLLVTASPSRADGQGLGRHADGIVDDMIIGPTMRELINLRYLTDYQIAVPETDFDRDALKITDSGDFSPKQMKEASEGSHIVGDVLVNYCKFAFGKQAIVFATDVETSNKMARQFNAVGIAAASVSAKTETSVRQELIRRFRAGIIRVLVNVDLFGEGFDLPAIEVVIMARPTASLAVYLQQFGRALRLLEGKAYGLIIDMVSNFKQHGFPDKPHQWTLNRRDKRAKQEPDPDDMPLQRCTAPLCMRAFPRTLRACPHCAKLVPVLAGGGVRELKQVDGDLLLLDADVLEKMRKDVALPTPAEVGAQRAFAAFGKGSGAQDHFAAQHQEKIDAQRALSDIIDLWAGHRIAAGDTTEMAYRRFYLTTGFSTLDMLHKDRSRADYDKTRTMIEGWLNK